MDDEVFLLGSESSALEVRPEVVDPPQTTAFPAALQAGISRHITPTALPVAEHVLHQLVVLFRRPQPLPQLTTTTAVAVALP